MEGLKIGLLATCLEEIANIDPEFNKNASFKVDNYILGRLKKYGEVIYPGFVLNKKDGKAAADEFIKNNVDMVVVCEISYTSSEIVYSALKNIDKLIVILNLQYRKTMGPDVVLKNISLEHCLVGSIEIASLLKRVGKKNLYTISGFASDETFEKLEPYLQAARVVKTLKNSNIGFIGNSAYPGMMDVEVDETLIKKIFGVGIVHLSIDEIADAYRSITKEEIDTQKAVFLKDYKSVSIKDDWVSDSIKMRLCYDRLIARHNLSSIANYCQTTACNSQFGFYPCLATSLCISCGVPFACEGDIGTSIALLIAQLLTGNSAFAELLMLDYERKSILFGHDGQGNLNYAVSKDEVNITTRYTGDKSIWIATSNYSYKQGRAILLNISMDTNCAVKMVISSGEVLNYAPLNISFPHGWYNPGMALDEFVSKWCDAGASHHCAVAYGDIGNTLKIIGDFLNLKIFIV
ncbi:MAG: hypothetical protein M1409_04135 [Actinobacteria bacterium]|nr:hypothetical protein [Actinomycetota bacterium]